MKKSMSGSERQNYRRIYPHRDPEISHGAKATRASDIYSFGYIYNQSLQEIKKNKEISLELKTISKLLMAYLPSQRLSLESFVSKLGEVNFTETQN